MAELEGKLPWGRWSLSAHNFPSSGDFHKIFGMHLQKGLVYLYIKKFLPPPLYFWNYNPSPNRQNNFLDWHSSTPPNTTPGCWMVQSIEDSPLQNISNRINWGRIQTLILYIKFPGFFRRAAIYKMAIKVSVRVQRIIGPFLGCQSSLGVILREKVIFDFFSRIEGGRRVTFVAPLPRKSTLHLKKKYHVFGKKSFRIIQERSYCSAIFLKKPSFQNIWRKYHISMYFLRKIIFHFPSRR